MKLIANCILWIWSHFPIFCLSDDENYATLEWSKIKKSDVHYRMSLLNIMLGDNILYIITFDIKEKNFNWMHILRLQEIEGMFLSEGEIDGVQGRFRAHIQTLSEKDLQIEKEKLCYHIQNEEQRINTSLGKLNIYVTIILTVIPLVLVILDLKIIFGLPLILRIGVFFIVYSLLNICAYIFRAIKVQGIMKSRFSDLRASEEKGKEILVQYQYDWQQLNCKAQLFVSFVLNLQEWIIWILILSVGVSLGISCEDENKQILVNSESYDTVINVDIGKLDEPYSDSSIKWQEIILNIEQKECEHIIFILNKEEKIALFDSLKQYDDLEVDIMWDDTMDKGRLKIIQEE